MVKRWCHHTTNPHQKEFKEPQVNEGKHPQSRAGNGTAARANGRPNVTVPVFGTVDFRFRSGIQFTSNLDLGTSKDF
jgi:hypothetical protein